jgi:diamine N-acetyltransferase
MTIRIIRADISHAEAISAIGKKTFLNAFGHLFNSSAELFEYLNRTYDVNKLTKSIRKENNIYLLAWHDGEPIGFAKLKRHSLNDLIEPGAQMELQKIYVLKEFQRSGVCSALLKEVQGLARQEWPDYLWLSTYIANEKAIRLYERNGFQKIGRHYFSIGTQTFEFYVMGQPVAMPISNAC